MGLRSPHSPVERLRHIHCRTYRRSELWRESESLGGFRRDSLLPLDQRIPYSFRWVGIAFVYGWNLTRKLSNEVRIDFTECRIAPVRLLFSTGLTSPCGIAKVRQTAAPWALTPSAWGIRFSSCILVYAKEISPATEEYGCERCNPATASTFSKSLFLPVNVIVMNVTTSFHPSLFAYLCQCV